MILIFDTETNGKYEFKSHPHDPHQPDLVQLAAILVDDDFVIRHQICHVIRPDGWKISDEVAAVHGITQSIAVRVGMHVLRALEAIAALVDGADMIMAHNLDFDLAIMSVAFHRHFRSRPNPFDAFRSIYGPERFFCTMRAMIPICKLPGFYGDYKFPKLAEAYFTATGKQFSGAHDALNDVKGCLAIYRFLKRREALAAMRSECTDDAPVKKVAMS